MTYFEEDFLIPARDNKWDEVVTNSQYNSQENYWVLIKPTEEETVEFLNLISKKVDSDNSYYLYASMPSLKRQRSLAIADIRDWVSSKPKSFFPDTDINVNRAAAQFAMRVFWPDTLNQGHCGFCGPTTVLFDFDKRYPRKYAKCGMDLIGKGTGMVVLNDGQLGFDISLGRTEAGEWKSKNLPEADFIMLRAIRQKAKSLIPGSESGGMNFKFDEDPTHATTPTQIALLLEKAGYNDVKDYTIGWPGKGGKGPKASFAKNTNLTKCIWHLRAITPKPVVIMLIAVELADRALEPTEIDTSGRWNKAKALHELHWIVVEKLEFSGANVVGRLVTWTQSKDFSFDKSTFLDLYHGFVFAKP